MAEMIIFPSTAISYYSRCGFCKHPHRSAVSEVKGRCPAEGWPGFHVSGYCRSCRRFQAQPGGFIWSAPGVRGGGRNTGPALPGGRAGALGPKGAIAHSLEKENKAALQAGKCVWFAELGERTRRGDRAHPAARLWEVWPYRSTSRAPAQGCATCFLPYKVCVCLIQTLDLSFPPFTLPTCDHRKGS